MPRMFNSRLREVCGRGMAASPGDLPGLVLGKAEEKRSGGMKDVQVHTLRKLIQEDEENRETPVLKRTS